MSTKVFNFRCPTELLQAIEDFALAEGLTKTEAATVLLKLGLPSQSAEVSASKATANKNKPSAVISGAIELPSGQTVRVGDASWFHWLESPDTRSFRFEGRACSFTAQKQTPGASRFYWNAAKKIAGRVVKLYLGRSAVLTLDLLEEAAEKFATLKIRAEFAPSESVLAALGHFCPWIAPNGNTFQAECPNKTRLLLLSCTKPGEQQCRACCIGSTASQSFPVL